MALQMKDRLKKIRKTLDITQQEVADRLNVSRSNIAGYESGNSEPSEAVITLLCREFNVNRAFLLDGSEPMFVEKSGDEQLASFFGKVTTSDDSDAIKSFMKILADMDDEGLRKTREFLELFTGGNKDG